VIYQFGVFELDTVSGELRKSGRIVALEPQPMRALQLLLARAGEVVSREEAIATIWGSDTHVDFDRGLAYCIAQVRSALADTAESGRFVQTLPKRGFRFVAPVQRVEPSGPATLTPVKLDKRPGFLRPWPLAAAIVLLLAAGAWTVRAFLRPSRPVIAVSLFDNETGDPGYDRPIHTMADIVVDRLTALGSGRIGVVGNASVLRMPRNERDLIRIKEESGASFVVLAQLQSRQAGLSFIMHLIRLDDGTHLWTRRIARPAGDALAGLEEEAARAVESGVRQHVLGGQ
jgi:DNA-binding winged helix-turn-helix (wHTH) protein/TolB-like protein